jgi:DNA topoisomerase-3
MGKRLFIAEKPSVAAEFAKALKVNGRKQNGYIESDDCIVTWCVGHLITMSYPEKYDLKYKKWSMDTLPFLPQEFKYEVIDGVKGQFETVRGLLNRPDVDCIYICTDSGREGEYIYRLVDAMAGVKGKTRRRVWIDSQTEEEIQRGIREAKDWSAYDNLSAAAYLRAKEDYLMGINFSRVLTLKYGNTISGFLKRDRTVLSVGRVMTCVLGMTVRREREIRQFVKTPFYRVTGRFRKDGFPFEGEWRVTEGSLYAGSPKLYKENGFRKKEDAEELVRALSAGDLKNIETVRSEKKKEIHNAPLLYNLAEIQNDCSRRFKISPDETLQIIQELYEKKLVTYPRTDARVLSSAVAKEIDKNISGLQHLDQVAAFARDILDKGLYKGIAKTRYTNDSQITDHYAIIPTGQGFGALKSLNPLHARVYDMICRRFLSIFYPPAVYEKYALEFAAGREHFFTNFKLCTEEGWQQIAWVKKEADTKEETSRTSGKSAGAYAQEDSERDSSGDDQTEGKSDDPAFIRMIASLKKGSRVEADRYEIREGETSPPKRYTSGSMILAMENAGQLIEDEELRSQIKSCGIGTSATRAEILKKLVTNRYLSLNAKTQVITPELLGEMVYEAVEASIKPLLNPELTASWEKGLDYVAKGSISPDEYMTKLDDFVTRRTNHVKENSNGYLLKAAFEKAKEYYRPVRPEGKTNTYRRAKAGSTRRAAKGRTEK